ncbi:hydrogenase maturation protein [Candidatus Magnetobacterium bavaricum]|uniref:Hydrogenase maturation protein n=1 Tax=Candidatus Magnetobacterium bavaricum TaxID=29290 RepID=A0A0F3GXM3_9BACT|nr:hydrogenase maturation protein [Candidatus Magnetobacterium bavaricum]
MAFDGSGSGYGTDGALWGGEFLICNISGFTRFAHLDYFDLIGGQTAITQPWSGSSRGLLPKIYIDC